jgi:hypothetical protein
MVRQVIARTTFTRQEEQEAELLASLIWERANSTATRERHPNGEVAVQLHRLAMVLERPDAHGGV